MGYGNSVRTGRLKKFFLAGALAVAVAPAMAQDQAEAGGKIVVYRQGSMFGAAVACPIRIEGVEVAELGRGKYVELEVAAGRHILTNKNSSVEVTVEDGETRYVRCKIRAGILAGGAELQIVGPADFNEIARKLERKDPMS